MYDPFTKGEGQEGDDYSGRVCLKVSKLKLKQVRHHQSCRPLNHAPLAALLLQYAQQL